jgi:hypothetical protein
MNNVFSILLPMHILRVFCIPGFSLTEVVSFYLCISSELFDNFQNRQNQCFQEIFLFSNSQVHPRVRQDRCRLEPRRIGLLFGENSARPGLSGLSPVPAAIK